MCPCTQSSVSINVAGLSIAVAVLGGTSPRATISKKQTELIPLECWRGKSETSNVGIVIFGGWIIRSHEKISPNIRPIMYPAFGQCIF